MKQGYQFDRETCPVCNEEVSANWMVRHLRRKHPLTVNASLYSSEQQERAEKEKIKGRLASALMIMDEKGHMDSERNLMMLGVYEWNSLQEVLLELVDYF